jgi:hypothetical protein
MRVYKGVVAMALIVVLLVVTVDLALARRRASGPGCALGPDEAIAGAEAGDVFTPLYEEEFGRNTNGVVIPVAMEIEGGWSSPNFDCGGNSSGVFETPEEMLAVGLEYNPANRSSLVGFDSPVLQLDVTVPSLALRNVNLMNTDVISGNGGVLRLAGPNANPIISTVTISITNSAFRPGFFIATPVGVQGDGGGLFLDLDNASQLTISDSLFKDQTAQGKGGGFAITVRGGSEVTLLRNLIEGNRAATCGGGVITIHSGTVILSDNVFQNNGADGEVADLCIERAENGSGSAVVYLFGNTFSTDGLRIDPSITVFTEQVFLPLLRR